MSQWFQEYKKGLNCKRCGLKFKDYPLLCEFHHVNDQLASERVIKKGMASLSKVQLIEQLSVTIPLCVLCHREIHDYVP